MQQLKKVDVDVILDVLKQTLAAYPTSSFIASLLNQYIQRGGLSKKQLEGMLHKASTVKDIAPGKIATIEAIILKKKSKHSSPLPTFTPLFTKDEEIGNFIAEILVKFPQHKRVLFLQTRYNNNEPFSTVEKEELQRLHKLLMEKKM